MDIKEFRNQVNKLFVKCKEKNIEYIPINESDVSNDVVYLGINKNVNKKWQAGKR